VTHDENDNLSVSVRYARRPARRQAVQSDAIGEYVRQIEGAANHLPSSIGRAPHRHVSRLYERVARRKGHQKAIGAVARHLAEATYWILTKQEA